MDGHTSVTMHGVSHRIDFDGCAVDANLLHIVWCLFRMVDQEYNTTAKNNIYQSCISCMYILGLASNFFQLSIYLDYFCGWGHCRGCSFPGAGPEHFWSTFFERRTQHF